MKQIITLAAVLAFSMQVWAQEPVLPPGQYLLVTDVKDGMATQKCEITSDKTGTFVTFQRSKEHSGLEIKPVRVFVQGANFQFSIGPGDYVQAADRSQWDIITYRGQIVEGVIKGDACEDSVTKVKFGKFLLYKQ